MTATERQPMLGSMAFTFEPHFCRPLSCIFNEPADANSMASGTLAIQVAIQGTSRWQFLREWVARDVIPWMNWYIDGFRCITCAGLDTMQREQRGIVQSKSNYEARAETIEFHPDLVTEKQIGGVIEELGFSARE